MLSRRGLLAPLATPISSVFFIVFFYKIAYFSLQNELYDVQLIVSLLDEETFDEENAKVVNLEGKHLMIAEDFVSVRKEIDDLMWKNTSMSSPE